MNENFKASLTTVLLFGFLVLVSFVLFMSEPMVPPDVVARPAFTATDLDRFHQQDLRATEIDKEARAAGRIYARHACTDPELFRNTAAAAVDLKVPVTVLAALVVVESHCQPDARSRAGAVGLTQVVPKYHPYARGYLLRPETNLRAGAEILRTAVNTCGGVRCALKMYFGVTEGSTSADEYADQILTIAGRR